MFFQTKKELQEELSTKHKHEINELHAYYIAIINLNEALYKINQYKNIELLSSIIVNSRTKKTILPIDLFIIKLKDKDIKISLSSIDIERKFYKSPTKEEPFYYYPIYNFIIDDMVIPLDFSLKNKVLIFTYKNFVHHYDTEFEMTKELYDKVVYDEKSKKLIEIFGEKQVSYNNGLVGNTDCIPGPCDCYSYFNVDIKLIS